MSSFGVIEHKNYSLRVPPASRLIPGQRSMPVQRKKVQSVRLDGQHWSGSFKDSAELTPELNVATQLAHTFLPRPSNRNDMYRLVAQVCADMLFPLLTLAALSVLSQKKLENSGIGILLIYGSLLTLIAHSEGLYTHRSSDHFESVVLGKVIALTTILVAIIVRLTRPESLPMSLLVVSAPLNYFGLLTWRNVVQQQHRRKKGLVRNVLIVGAGSLGTQIAAYINQHHPDGRYFRGFLDDSAPIDADIRGKTAELSRVARSDFIDEVILAIPQERELSREIIREARKNHLDIKVVPDLLGFDPMDDGLESYGVVPVVTLHSEHAPAFQLLLKRALDCLISGAALVFCAPLMAALAVLVKIDSPGPVLYCAPRMGSKGREFLCYKFRTMYVNADAEKEKLRDCNQRQGAFFKIAHDPRLTRIGYLLRRYSLDELPQLWNVLLGAMSMVGPRPHPLDDFRRYRLEDFRRLDVMPGITGLWQVTARRDPSFERNMALDLQYIEQWNLWLDLKILWKTLSVVVHGTGA